MLLRTAYFSTLRTAFALVLCINLSIANPFPRTLLSSEFPSNQSLDLRDSSCGGQLCGYYNQLCCVYGEACATENGLATCTAAAATPAAAVSGGGSGWQLYTTTFVETDLSTITTVYSVQVGGASPTAVATSAPGGTCNANLGQRPCGTQGLCCQSTEWCYQNQCINAYGSSSGAPATESQASTISNFIAPTSVGVATVTSSMSITTTIPFQTPVGSSGSVVTGQMVSANNGLSPGAIAGIVIGVLVGLFLLFLLLACLCCRSLIDGIFGRRKRKETTTYIETHHSHHGSGGPPPRRRWFGALPARAERKEKKSGGFGGLLGVGAFLATLAVLLGLRRKTKTRVEEKSEYTVSDYTYDYDDYTTSASSASSDRRTRNTRHSRR